LLSVINQLHVKCTVVVGGNCVFVEYAQFTRLPVCSQLKMLTVQ